MRSCCAPSHLRLLRIGSFLTLRLPQPLFNTNLQTHNLEHLHNYYNIVNTNINTNANINPLILERQSYTSSCDMSSLPLSVLSGRPWRGFTDLPSELRQPIYDALLVDPIRTQSRRVCTVDKLGNSSWSRTEVPLPANDESAIDNPPAPIRSSISHLDYSDLWSLARVNKLFYSEATPTIYSHAQLEYISGNTHSTRANSTLLHTYLHKVLPATSTLYRNLTIIDGRNDLFAKEMKNLVDLINHRMPNLHSLKIQVYDPGLEGWPDIRYPRLLIDDLQMLAAVRPLARLTFWPEISIKHRLCFYPDLDSFRDDPHLAAVNAAANEP